MSKNLDFNEELVKEFWQINITHMFIKSHQNSINRFCNMHEIKQNMTFEEFEKITEKLKKENRI